MAALTRAPVQTCAPIRAILLLFLILAPAPVRAIDKSKAVATMIANAGTAYEAGDYDRASELYLAAFRSDPAQHWLLHNAGRSAQLAGKVDKAEELYRQLLELRDVDPAVVQKAQAYLAEVRHKRAEDKADEAGAALKAGNSGLAAQLFAQAWSLAPDRTAYLFRAAQADLQGGARAEATRKFKEFIAKAEPNSPERAQAQGYLDRLAAEDAAKKASIPVARPAAGSRAPAVAAPADAAGTGRRWWGWGLSAAGAAGIGVAGWALVASLGAQDAFDAGLRDANGDGLHDMTYAEATRLSQRIGSLQTLAVAAGGAGLAAAGAGVWFLSTAPARAVVVVPMPQGALVVARF